MTFYSSECSITFDEYSLNLPVGTACGAKVSSRYLSMLHPEEVTTGMSYERAQQFATGRYCARMATGLSLPIVREPSGEPWFPSPFKGSISHTEKYALAWATTEAFALGVDIEDATRTMSEGALEIIASEEERRSLHTFQQAPLLLFSMKESIFKLIFSLKKRWSEPQETRVDVSKSSLKVELELEIDCHLSISATVAGEVIATAAALLPDHRLEKASRFSLFSK